MQNLALAILGLAASLTTSDQAATSAMSVRTLLRPHGDRLAVVAHRGCHRAAPSAGLASAPENSLAALENCVRLGVEMAEVDVRRSADGALIILHDATLDRTTSGAGAVAKTTLEQVRGLRLRAELGGADAELTAERVPTLDELLQAARGRILLNLDIKDPVYAEVIDAVQRAGMADQVLIKAVAGPNTAPLAAISPYDQTPFAPILQDPGPEPDLAAVAATQARAPIAPVVFELPMMRPQQLEGVAQVSRSSGVGLWVNTLWSGFVTGWGGDADALIDPDQVWGRLYRVGVRVIQTDEPAALVAFRERCCMEYSAAPVDPEAMK